MDANLPSNLSNLNEEQMSKISLIHTITSDKIALKACYMMLFGIIITTAIQNFVMPNFGLVGLYVPDALGYKETFNEISNNFEPLKFIFEQPSSLTLLIYYPFYLLYPSTLIIPNIIMLTISIFLASIKFKKFGTFSTTIACFSFALNPYYYLAAAGVSKEIPLSMMIMLFISVKHTWSFAPILLIIAALTYYLRDGLGLIMFCWILIYLLTPKLIPQRTVSRLALIFPPMASLSYYVLSELIPAIKRNITVTIDVANIAGSELGAQNIQFALLGLESPQMALTTFIYRCIANAFSLPIRPSFLTSKGEIALISLAYWIYGFFLAISMLGLVLMFADFCTSQKQSNAMLLANEESRFYLTNLLIFLWLGISVTLFIQPRYLMPIISPILGIIATLSINKLKKVFLIVCIFTFVGQVILNIIGIPPLEFSNSELPEKPWFFLFY